MAKRRLSHCRICKRGADEGAIISKRGLCVACGWSNQAAANEQMRTGKGPIYAKWRASGGARGNGQRPEVPGGAVVVRGAHGKFRRAGE